MHRHTSARYLILSLMFVSFFLRGQDSLKRPKVMVMEIRDEIDAPMQRYVRLALENAREIKADVVIVDMDTYGGVLTDAKEIVDLIMDFPKPIWVFINSDAASAGALISIACDSIYMAPGATIGAATVVNGNDGSAAPDKYQSYMRSIMRSTAEENKRNPQIAEGMVDETLEIEGIKEAGKVITFTTTEALQYGFCDAKVESIAEILERNGVRNYELETYELSIAEKIIAFIINPAVSGLLILAIIAGLYFEMQAPGIGLPLLVSVTALVLYLVPYYLNGLAENWEIIALFVGILLIAAEIFFIPGFGVAGIAGITLTVGSLILVMVNNDAFNFDYVPSGDLAISAFAALGGIAGGIALLLFGGARLTRSKAFQRVANYDTQRKEEGYTANFVPHIQPGARGNAHTILRPGGKVMIDGQVYDAFTRGEYIEQGEPVEVIGAEASTLKVRKLI